MACRPSDADAALPHNPSGGKKPHMRPCNMRGLYTEPQYCGGLGNADLQEDTLPDQVCHAIQHPIQHPKTSTFFT